MSEITIDTNPVTRNRGLNKYDLLQSESDEVVDKYQTVLNTIEGSLTTVTDNDSSSKFTVAITNLDPTPDQIETLMAFQKTFKAIENHIHPDLLQFDIDKTVDNEFCIFRKSDNGLSNIIINDDGTASFSFIAYKYSSKEDVFFFIEKEEISDCEKLAFQFFSL